MNGREIVKKNAGAIHIKNDISCLQRKVWNVFLLNAYEELANPRIAIHQIKVSELMKLTGFDSKNIGYLKEALEDMVTTKLTWNIIDDAGKAEWGVSAALASATISGGICSYAYSPHLRPMLYNPEFYARIDILILSRFSSGHALALYENCLRYRNIHQTPYLSIEIFRDLIGVGQNASYDDFKVLNRAVIKPALKEVNSISDITLDIEMKRERRKVIAVKFLIQENMQESLPIEATHTFDSIILNRLLDQFCLTEKQAKEAMVTHSEDRIQAVMKYVEDRYKTGKVKIGKITPYFLKVLRDGDIKIGESSFDREKKEEQLKRDSIKHAAETEEQLKSKFMRLRNDKIKSYLENLSIEERTKLDSEFGEYLRSNNHSLLPKWRRDGINSKILETVFYSFVGNELLPPFDADLEVFMKENVIA